MQLSAPRQLHDVLLYFSKLLFMQTLWAQAVGLGSVRGDAVLSCAAVQRALGV